MPLRVAVIGVLPTLKPVTTPWLLAALSTTAAAHFMDALSKMVENGVIEAAGNPCLARLRNTRASLGLAEVVFPFHKPCTPFARSPGLGEVHIVHRIEAI